MADAPNREEIPPCYCTRQQPNNKQVMYKKWLAEISQKNWPKIKNSRLLFSETSSAADLYAYGLLAFLL